MPNVDLSTLEAPVRELVEASNTEDRERFLETFTDDATLTDFGRTFTGQGEIGRWSDAEHVGVCNHLEVTGVTRSPGGDVVTIAVLVSGGGFNGPSRFVLSLDDNRTRITHMEIAA